MKLVGTKGNSMGSVGPSDPFGDAVVADKPSLALRDDSNELRKCKLATSRHIAANGLHSIFMTASFAVLPSVPDVEFHAATRHSDCGSSVVSAVHQQCFRDLPPSTAEITLNFRMF